jgi:hypothetical protein
MPQLAMCCVIGDLLLNKPLFTRHYVYSIKCFTVVRRLVAYQDAIDISEEHIFFSENTDSLLLLIIFPSPYALHCAVTHNNSNVSFHSREKHIFVTL